MRPPLTNGTGLADHFPFASIVWPVFAFGLPCQRVIGRGAMRGLCLRPWHVKTSTARPGVLRRRTRDAPAPTSVTVTSTVSADHDMCLCNISWSFSEVRFAVSFSLGHCVAFRTLASWVQFESPSSSVHGNQPHRQQPLSRQCSADDKSRRMRLMPDAFDRQADDVARRQAAKSGRVCRCDTKSISAGCRTEQLAACASPELTW